MRIFLIVIYLAFGFLPASAIDSTEAASCLKIGYLEGLAEAAKETISFNSVFLGAGICAEAILLSTKRAEQQVMNGQLDGEFMRTAIWAARFKDKIVSVPTPVYVDHMAAVSLARKDHYFTSLEDLKRYRVVIWAGHRWAQAKTSELGIQPIEVSSIPRFMELLMSNKADVGLVEKSMLSWAKGADMLSAPAVAEIPYHIVLHKKYADLVPLLDASIKERLSTP